MDYFKFGLFEIRVVPRVQKYARFFWPIFFVQFPSLAHRVLDIPKQIPDRDSTFSYSLELQNSQREIESGAKLVIVHSRSYHIGRRSSKITSKAQLQAFVTLLFFDNLVETKTVLEAELYCLSNY